MMDAQDDKLLSGLRQAAEGLYTAWKFARTGSPAFLEINRIQMCVQDLMRDVRASLGSDT